jgi:hypothetical protein
LFSFFSATILLVYSLPLPHMVHGSSDDGRRDYGTCSPGRSKGKGVDTNVTGILTGTGNQAPADRLAE